MTWLPISIAPKDGSDVILLIDGVTISDRWVTSNGKNYQGIEWESADWKRDQLDSEGCGCCGGTDSEPTHWMPLLEPPNEQKD